MQGMPKRWPLLTCKSTKLNNSNLIFSLVILRYVNVSEYRTIEFCIFKTLILIWLTLWFQETMHSGRAAFWFFEGLGVKYTWCTRGWGECECWDAAVLNFQLTLHLSTSLSHSHLLGGRLIEFDNKFFSYLSSVRTSGLPQPTFYVLWPQSDGLPSCQLSHVISQPPTLDSLPPRVCHCVTLINSESCRSQ